MKQRRVVTLTLIVSIILLFSPIIFLSDSKQFDHLTPPNEQKHLVPTSKPKSFSALSLTPHAPIEIISDENFTDYGFPGYGNFTHPYIIGNLSITNPFIGNSIYIKDTSKHFQIQNCFLSTEGYGIYIQDVSNGTVSIVNNYCRDSSGIYLINATGSEILDNTCTLSSYEGIEAFNSDYLLIKNNTCIFNRFTGIYLYKCNYSLITNNNCSYNDLRGIYLKYSSFSNINSNICNFNNFDLDNSYGIYVSNCESTNFSSNTCDYNSVGLRIYYSQEILIFNNSFKNNELWDGISIRFASNFILTNNTCYKNFFGIRAEYCNQSVFMFNQLQENRAQGIYLHQHSFDNVLYYNYFKDNNPERRYPGKAQAIDNSKTNTWYNTETKIGNWWSDLRLRCRYRLSGEGEAVDLYPMNVVNFCLDRLLPTIIIPIISITAFIIIIKYVIPYLRK